MSREIWIDGKTYKVPTVSDIAPNGLEELRELCKTTKPGETGFWNSPVSDVPPGVKAPKDHKRPSDSKA